MDCAERGFQDIAGKIVLLNCNCCQKKQNLDKNIKETPLTHMFNSPVSSHDELYSTENQKVTGTGIFYSKPKVKTVIIKTQVKAVRLPQANSSKL